MSFSGVCGGAGCSVHLQGSGAMQLEGLGGVAIRF
jgi:hypothetical protein